MSSSGGLKICFVKYDAYCLCKCNAYVEPVTTGVANIFKVAWVILCASLEKLVLILNKVSSEYREVSRQLAKEKKQKKMERQASDLNVKLKKVKCAMSLCGVGGLLISLSKALERVGG